MRLPMHEVGAPGHALLPQSLNVTSRGTQRHERWCATPRTGTLDFATWQLALAWPNSHQTGLAVHVAAFVQGTPRRPMEEFSLPSQASSRISVQAPPPHTHPPTATGASSLPIDSNDVVRWQKRADSLAHMAFAEGERANVERYAKACLAAALAQVCMLRSEEQSALDALDVPVHEKQTETVNHPTGDAVAPKLRRTQQCEKGRTDDVFNSWQTQTVAQRRHGGGKS